MSVDTNPFSAPQYVPPPVFPEVRQKLVHAGKGERLAHLILDQIVLYGLSFVLAIPIVVWIMVTYGEESLDSIGSVVDVVFAIAIRLIYYIGMESLFGHTLGKLATGSIVVNERGERPSFGQVVGRTFARFIPFEPFSFLGSGPGGWHDTLSKTFVVKANSVRL